MMSKLRPDLTIKAIDDELDIGEWLDYTPGDSARIHMGSGETRHIPDSWLKPKVKKWTWKKSADLKIGDVMVFNGRLFSISLVDGDLVENTMVISIWGNEDCLYRHKNEFVTVEVEE